jgi:predicted metal-dependent peptidase
MLRHAMIATYGFGQFTYRKASRRQSPGGAIPPRHQKPVPDLVVLGNTSGSMNHRDLGMVLGVVAGVSRRLGTNGKLEVWTADTHVASVQKVFRPEEVHLVGGGGTDMRAMILSVMERRPKPPEVILVATDGVTPWPEKPVEAKVMACLTRKSRAKRVPEWIETVVLRPEDED